MITKSDDRAAGVRGRPSCLSRVWLQTKLDHANSCFKLITKVTISEKRKNSQVMKERKNLHQSTEKRRRKLLVIETKVAIGGFKLQL